MFTLAEVNAAAPPSSPIPDSGDYWTGILKLAERKVKSICRRALDSATYTDTGYTLPVENPDGSMVYVWHLREPTGTALAFSAFTTLKLDDATVDEADVTIEAGRLIFSGPGEVEATYPGGYMRDEIIKAELLQAVIATMHAIHLGLQKAETPDFAQVEDMLAPFKALLVGGGYAKEPD